MTNFKDLKKGDKLKYVQFGNRIYNGVVIENFPDKELIYLKLKIHFFFSIKTICAYQGYNLFIAKKV